MPAMKAQLILLGAAIAAGLLFAIVGTVSVANSAAQTGDGMSQGQGKGNMTMTGGSDDSEKPSFIYKLNNKYRDYENGVFKVRAGTGGHVAPLTMFFPKHAEIKVGETVVFYNPTSVQEPHTVTFIMDNSTFADFVAPYVVMNGTSLSPIPNSNSEPILVPGPGGQNMILGLNNRSFSPTVIDSDGKVTYLPPNANYTVSGTEKYINSGWIWPKDQAPQGLAPIDSFSLTFAKEGTYNYMCVVHPWMSGDVVVK